MNLGPHPWPKFKMKLLLITTRHKYITNEEEMMKERKLKSKTLSNTRVISIKSYLKSTGIQALTFRLILMIALQLKGALWLF